MANKLHVKKGDTVVVIAGKDAGATGKVLAASPSKGKVVVEGVAKVKRHTKPSKNDPQGGIMEKESFIDASNVMPYCPKCKKGVRIAHVADKNGKTVRACVKCGNKFDK
ncbi:MAG TPA: 50S ribosomal protein L24 [Candidatus Avidehalobacter gallistercoris]|uniref:Large ribosomal subunit protein uL24 n=1 Tax=Candidatus Avidehalobacter gallistercoris TaxID=2840694 RepID=A0A9D1HJC5_9FIRM|nr:50S ribosomal protein L24 [Candidatus Avidehalobacter gallistercoris]